MTYEQGKKIEGIIAELQAYNKKKNDEAIDYVISQLYEVLQ